MKESRVLALAGVFQATALAGDLATTGSCDESALEASLASVFCIDAPDAAAVFGGNANLRLGLRSLIAQLERNESDPALLKMMVSVLRLERSLSRRPAMREQLREGIVATQRQVDHFGITHQTVCARLSALYSETLSTLSPRIMVQGSPQYLQQETMVERTRAVLLAAVRAAVLWRQLGGRQWQLLTQRRQWVMLARGLLTGSTLDRG